jgi:hypothetical protein
MFLVLISVRGGVNYQGLVQPEGLEKTEKTFISLGLEPATFRLLA